MISLPLPEDFFRFLNPGRWLERVRTVSGNEQVIGKDVIRFTACHLLRTQELGITHWVHGKVKRRMKRVKVPWLIYTSQISLERSATTHRRTITPMLQKHSVLGFDFWRTILGGLGSV
jgi:hypothetical protein